MCDEGNDIEDKNFAIVVCLWDEDLGRPLTRFLDMPVCNVGTAENLFGFIDTALGKRGIAWSNVAGFEPAGKGQNCLSLEAKPCRPVLLLMMLQSCVHLFLSAA